ncbi:MAG: phosphoenolpyruvate--protein phosphotransferase [Chloroflexia bacterium]
MTVLHGIGVSRGIAIGPARNYRPAEVAVPPRKPGSPAQELERLESALERARQEVEALHAAAHAVLRREADRLLEAQSLLLGDPGLVERTRALIRSGLLAETAWQEAVRSYLSIFAPIQDEDLEARVADLQEVGQRVLAALLELPPPAPFSGARGTILVAAMIGPAEALQLAAQPPLGLCLAHGSRTSPVTAVARRLGIPAVIGLGESALRQLPNGATLVVDGSTGTVEIEPDEEALAQYRRRLELLRAAQPSFDASLPAQTADGWRVDVRADLERPDEWLAAFSRGAEGVGLARTDFLFRGRSTPPTEEEQIEAYRGLLEQLPPGRVGLCTLSTGLEEMLPFPAEPEMRNPLLGLRGIRLSLAYLSAFREQLRALLRAAAGRPLLVVFPMVETLAELRAALEWLKRARQDLQKSGCAYAEDVHTGLLLQTPLAVLNVAALAGEVDTFLLDMDRLTEYLLACDRHNLRVAHLFRPLHPTVLRLASEAIAVVHRAGKRLEACGESAGIPAVAALLLGLGADGFCLSPERVPGIKALLRCLSIPEVQRLAADALRQPGAPEVEALAEGFLQGLGPIPGT